MRQKIDRAKIIRSILDVARIVTCILHIVKPPFGG